MIRPARPGWRRLATARPAKARGAMTTGPGLVLAAMLLLGPAALAEPLPADCARLTAALQSFGGYRMTAAPQAAAGGWCVLDGADFAAAAGDLPDLSVDRLRLRGGVEGAALVRLEVDVAGLRLRPRAEARATDDRLRAVLGLQSADLRLTAVADPAANAVAVRELRLVLSGGTELDLAAAIAGAGLDLASLAGGRLTALQLTWRQDGRLLRPVMERVGAAIAPAATGSLAVDAARGALRGVIAALPEAAFAAADRRALERWAAAVPQGRGQLALSLAMPEGIGAAQLVMLAMADDPAGPAALAALFAGATARVAWHPGLRPRGGTP